MTPEELAAAIEMEKGGTISEYLDDMIETGFIAKDTTWNLAKSKESNLLKYRLKDNYIRFYLKYIEPNRTQIEKNRIKVPPAWSSIMGIQFENLVLNNSHFIHNHLGIQPGDIVYDNPYFQRPTNTHTGCQIDYLIQDKFNTLYICEIKFSKEPVGSGIIQEIKEKIKALHYLKHFSFRPILIHVNGVKESVLESGFFAKIIDFGDFL